MRPRHNASRSFLYLASLAKKGPAERDHWPSAQVEQIARTVRRTPEVMVKISGGGTSHKGVVAHFGYIGRKDFQIETDDAERIQGRAQQRALVDEWDLELDAAEARTAYRGVAGRKPKKLVHNIVLSMPKGTPASAVLSASRAFAREQFALKHRYAMVLHTDQPHPHVHLVVKAMSEQGERLHISREMLREWRREFARHLRALGIDANATDRVVRGISKTRKLDAIHWAARDGRSTHMRTKVSGVADDLRQGTIRDDPGKARLIESRRDVARRWLAVAKGLRDGGKETLALEVLHFAKTMPPPRTEREQIAEELLEQVRTGKERALEPFTR